MASPIGLLIQDFRQITRLESSNIAELPTIRWELNGTSIKANPLQKISDHDWVIFSIALSSMSAPLPLTSLVLTVPFLAKERLCEILRKSTLLTRLKLENYVSTDLEFILREVGRYCLKLTDVELSYAQQLDMSLLENCTQISKFSLNYCSAPMEKSLMSWLRKAGGQLKVLSTYHCNDMTDNVLMCLNTSAPLLETLNIGGCPHLSSSHLKCLNESKIKQLHMNEIRLDSDAIKNCPKLFSQLVEFSVAKGGLNDETCPLLAGSCPHLKKLNLRDNPQISFETLQVLIPSLTHLQFLDLQGSSLSQEQMGQLAGIRNNLRVIPSFT